MFLKTLGKCDTRFYLIMCLLCTKMIVWWIMVGIKIQQKSHFDLLSSLIWLIESILFILPSDTLSIRTMHEKSSRQTNFNCGMEIKAFRNKPLMDEYILLDYYIFHRYDYFYSCKIFFRLSWLNIKSLFIFENSCHICLTNRNVYIGDKLSLRQ